MPSDHTPQLSFASDHRVDVDWTSLLDSIGTAHFETALKRFLRGLVGPAGRAAFFHEALGELVTGCDCAAAGERGQTPCGCRNELNGSPHWIHFEDGPWHAAIAVAWPGRSQWAESSELSHRLAGTAGALSAILRKHIGAGAAQGAAARADAAIAFDDRKESEPLSCLSTIEQCIAESVEMPRRELEVCSRILFGLTSPAIALDLHLCDTTIKTYRKRAYHRLSIGSERELLIWYLRAWVRWQRQKEKGRAHTPALA
jgi:DNA-binding CsgD family transcriptional regulator